MTKIWYHRSSGQAAVFDMNEDMANWLDYQEKNPNPPPALTQEQKARVERDFLLSKSDTMALVDRVTNEWKTYRQALRDVPAQSGFPDNITWPTEPE